MIAKNWIKPTTPWLFLLLPLIVLFLALLIPMGMAFYISLLDYGQDILKPDFVGLANYAALFTWPRFWQLLGQTVLLTLMVVPPLVVIPIGVAILVNNMLRGVTLFRTLIYLPVVVSVVITAIAWKWLYASDGLINYGLSTLGFSKVQWLSAPEVAMWAVAVMVIWKGIGYYMMMYLSGLQSISGELYEAAAVDGANRWRQHAVITLPHLQPTMAMVLVISTIGALKIFPEIYVMTRGGPVGATETLVYGIYDEAFGNLNLGMACAMGFVFMLLLLGLSWINIKWGYLRQEQALKDAY